MRSRFLVWQRHHILHLLMGTAQEDNEDNELDFSSFLQTSAAHRSSNDMISDCFAAVCTALKQQMEEGYEEVSDFTLLEYDSDEYLPMWVAHKQDNMDAKTDSWSETEGQVVVQQDPVLHSSGLDQAEWIAQPDRVGNLQRMPPLDSDIVDVRAHLRALFDRGMEGINKDFQDIPALHPHARLASELTMGGVGQGDMHIFTDGSCKNGRATWAISVVQQCSFHGPVKYRRVGFAAGEVDDSLGDCEQTAMDAEATAIIAMIEFALGICQSAGGRFYCHFDAQTVGFGATGKYNVTCWEGHLSQRQLAARILMTILERKLDGRGSSVSGKHVKAHQGHPWNEMADNIAKAVWHGWQPPIPFKFRSGCLLRHSLAQWAWLEVAPDAELPDLATMLRNESPSMHQGEIDSTLLRRQEDAKHRQASIQLKLATVNVGTMDYHNDIEYGMNWKALELAKQFDEQNLHVVGIQECRARVSRRVTTGPYVRLIQAGVQGQAGVELWIHYQAFQRMFGYDFNVDKDLCAWYSTSRALAVRCSVGTLHFDLVVLYAPQRGRPKSEINAWWAEIQDMLCSRKRDVPLFILGDLNCRVGSVMDDCIGSHAGDLEDEAGEWLRNLCNELDLMAPATFSHLHDGPTGTSYAHNGASSRVDFILIPLQCQHDVVRSYVDQEMDIMNGDKDHRPSVLEIHLRWKPSVEAGYCRCPFYDRDAARNMLQIDGTGFLDDVPPQQWKLDVNQHWTILRQHMQMKAGKYFPKQKRKQRQLYFQSNTWLLLCDRRDLRIQHRDIQRTIQLKVLFRCFQAWAKGSDDLGAMLFWDLEMSVLRQQEAITLEARIKTDARFRACKKKDWRKWVDDQLQQRIDQANQRSSVDLFSILQPKKMIFKHAGKLTKPVPGLRDEEGAWQFSRACIARAWQGQFSKIENAETVEFQDLLARSKPDAVARTVVDLHAIPTLLDVERALRALNKSKAAGLDGLGAELFQQGCASMAKRIFPLVLKMGLRCQGVPELTGGWLLPLFKNKGSAQLMTGYRAILLEPVLARAISKAWRPMLEKGLQATACPMQWGGRSGLSIEALHLQVRIWQADARKRQLAHFLLFIDIKSAFYSVVKEMLTGNEGGLDVKRVFQRMGLPMSAWDDFQQNVMGENLIYKATQSNILAKSTQAMLSHTWFVIPDGTSIQSPMTGSRPGDPNADLLFSFIMTHILGKINGRAATAQMPLYSRDADGFCSTRCVTWVDDLAISVEATAETIVTKATQMLAVVQEVMLEHGMRLSYGMGKTAVVAAFHGHGAIKARQKFEQTSKQGIPVFTEHEGCSYIPVFSHYKHLGGQLTRRGNCLQEIRVRVATTLAKLKPLRKILQNPGLELAKKQILVRSIGLSVLSLHSGTWADMTQTEIQAWQSGVFKVYQAIQPRDAEGNVVHKQMFELAKDMDSPMPVELLYIQRLRLLFHLIQVADEFMIHSIIRSLSINGEQSWLYGVIKAVNWMRRQVGNMMVPEELSELADVSTWSDFQPCVRSLKNSLKKAQKAHLIKVRTYHELRLCAHHQETILREMGWRHDGDDECGAVQPEDGPSCRDCGMMFKDEASLATHQQRRHGHRTAMRRFAIDGACRVCGRFYHTRPRLLRHLHVGQTGCWIEQCRRFWPLSAEEASVLDSQDKDRGVALHQSGFVDAHLDKAWRYCTEEEMQGGLECRNSPICEQGEPTDEELQEWAEFGLLPPGQGGRSKTQRKWNDLHLHNVCRATCELEQNLNCRNVGWQPNYDWVPHPLSCGTRYFLIFFSGHRRFADIASWMTWQGDVQPLCLDLAIDAQYGDVMQDQLWRRLIAARRVAGAHAAPPCETYTLARWLEVKDATAPRPLRDSASPWGKDDLTLAEVTQCHVGTVLMLRALQLLLLVYCHGGSISLEHPKGANNENGRWTIWDSAFMKQLLLLPQVFRIDFIQGPLGQPFTKPTSMLVGRLEHFAWRLYSHYQPNWRPSEWLGGKEKGGRAWRTAKAKAYPPAMCKVIAEAHLEFASQLGTEGFEQEPEELAEAVKALNPGFDPYLKAAKGATMTSDYWATSSRKFFT